MIDAGKLSEGARNLLLRCGEFGPGSEVLIVHEDPALGWYDLAAPMAVADAAGKLDLKVGFLKVGAPSEQLPSLAAELMERHQNLIFFARIGDQDRFAERPPGSREVMCYIRNARMLASDFGTMDHGAMAALKHAVDDILLGAENIEITCPLGSRVTGRVSGAARESSADVSIRRFPLGVPQPVDATAFSGTVALARYLTPTGSKAYDPTFLAMDGLAFAHFTQGRIESFSGDVETVRLVESHYEHVSGLFDIDRGAVHSWHAGIHPGCAYDLKVGDDPDRWSNTVFCNPRALHFHTCGAYAPGEICWMVMDHTLRVDGVALWEDGRMRPERFGQTQACLDAWPGLSSLFEKPARNVGL